MSYDLTEPTSRDLIRGRVLDTSNDPATEYLVDATYDAIMARFTDYRLAGAEIASRIYRMIASRPVAVSSGGDSVRWSDSRATAILAARDEFLADVEGDGYGKVFRIHDTFLTGAPVSGAEW